LFLIHEVDKTKSADLVSSIR